MGNVNMEACQINYRGGEKKMSVEEALKNTSGEAAAIAQLQTDVLNLNSNKANQITIAPFFSAEASYDPGDLVYYNGLSYRCVNAHEGEWDADDFAATTIAGELDLLKSGLTSVQSSMQRYVYSVIITPTVDGKISIPYSTAGVSSRPNSVFVTLQSKPGFATYDFDQSANDYIELLAFERELEGSAYTDTFIPVKANEPVRLCVLVYA